MRQVAGGAGALLVVALVAGCVVSRPAGAAWEQVPDGPLSARSLSSVTWVEDRFVVVGGDDGPPCPPTADCAVPAGTALRDGATFDPATGHWERIADAPTPILVPVEAVLGSTLYLLMDAPPAFFAYDVPTDRWTELPAPPDGVGRLVPHGDVLLSVPGSDEQTAAVDSWFDPVTSTWHRLPDDPLGPSYDRSVVVVDGRVLLTAKDLVPRPGADEPSLVRMAELDSALTTWTVLPDSEVIGYDPVPVAGRLVFPDLGGADGGEVGNWGRTYPFGGIYDPAAGTWADLPSVTGRTSWPRLVVGDRVRVGDVLLDPVDGNTTPVRAGPWTSDDSPTLAASPTAILAWGGMADRSATGFLTTPLAGPVRLSP